MIMMMMMILPQKVRRRQGTCNGDRYYPRRLGREAGNLW